LQCRAARLGRGTLRLSASKRSVTSTVIWVDQCYLNVMPIERYSELDDNWTVNSTHQSYTSQVVQERGEQKLIFAEAFGDGNISGDITCREGPSLAGGGIPRVAAFAFRFRDSNNYYWPDPQKGDVT
jgi:hypothetical protein